MSNGNGTITALDIRRALHEKATPREWRVIEGDMDGDLVAHILADEEPIAIVISERPREDADLIVRLRNTLPESIENSERLLARIRFLEARVKDLEKELEKGSNHG